MSTHFVEGEHPRNPRGEFVTTGTAHAASSVSLADSLDPGMCAAQIHDNNGRVTYARYGDILAFSGFNSEHKTSWELRAEKGRTDVTVTYDDESTLISSPFGLTWNNDTDTISVHDEGTHYSLNDGNTEWEAGQTDIDAMFGPSCPFHSSRNAKGEILDIERRCRELYRASKAGESNKRRRYPPAKSAG